MQTYFFSAVAAFAALTGYTAAYPTSTARDCGPDLTAPFYLTAVPINGTTTYPVFTAVVSRGIPVLSTSTSYFDQWTYNNTDNRLYINGTQTGTAAQQVGYSVIFGDEWGPLGAPYGDNGLLSLVKDHTCSTYLVMTGASSIYGWYALPTTTNDLPKTITWVGAGNGANAALRIGL